jgi:two-component system phosphate regulon sensor histidine kinase PhoR
VIVMHDVTDIRRLENIRKDFVANVSHELRTPVSIVQANAETLLDGALEEPARARTFVEALHRNAERLSRIIADLLDLSRLEAGRYRFDIASVDVEEAVERSLEAVHEKALGREQNIEVSIPEGQAVLADAKALEQVLSNLLENSIKYTPRGGHISVRAEERGGQVRLEIQDDGPGIEAEHRARIFERFYRIDPGRSRDMGGTGLGLAIVKHFVESMGGRVGVDPAFPRGSIFWVTLPLHPEHNLDAAV